MSSGRQALFVAGDRGVTRTHAEALVQRSLEAPRERGAEWSASRAHSALEALTLIRHGGRPFDVIVVAPHLPDGSGLELIAALRKEEATHDVPLFLMTERGHDLHSRRIAAARHRLAGFIELPVSDDTMRRTLDGVTRRRRVLVVDPDADTADLHARAFLRSGFVPEVAHTRDALEARRRFDPDVVVTALERDQDPHHDGLDLCARLKRKDPAPKVVVYGPYAALLRRRGIEANRERADDFVRGPFDEQLLVERAAALVGMGAPGSGPQAPTAPQVEAPPETGISVVELPPAGLVRSPRRAPVAPAPRPGPRRGSRRVPCDVTLTVERDGRQFRAETLDISPGGMFFAIHPPPPLGSTVEMDFSLPGRAAPVTSEGRVKWIAREAKPAGVGVEFSRIARADLEDIVDYVNRLARVVYDPDDDSSPPGRAP
ncbi:MAG: PilZ domain-containing protein [Myxococcota bacterium]